MAVERLERSEKFPRYSKRVADNVLEVGGTRVIGLFDRVYELDPDFCELYVEYVRGAMYSRTVLSQAVREMCACAALTLLNKPGLLKAHLLNGEHAGATRAELLEAIVQMVAFGGFPATLPALDVYRETFPDAVDPTRPPLPATVESLGDGPYYGPALEAASRIYGEDYARAQIDQVNEMAPDWSLAYQRLVLGGVCDRGVIEPKVRQLLAVAACVVLNALDEFEVEVRAGLRAGLSMAEVREVVVQMSVYVGMPYALQALRVFHRVAIEWEQARAAAGV